MSKWLSNAEKAVETGAKDLGSVLAHPVQDVEKIGSDIKSLVTKAKTEVVKGADDVIAYFTTEEQKTLKAIAANWPNVNSVLTTLKNIMPQLEASLKTSGANIATEDWNYVKSFVDKLAGKPLQAAATTLTSVKESVNTLVNDVTDRVKAVEAMVPQGMVEALDEFKAAYPTQYASLYAEIQTSLASVTAQVAKLAPPTK